MAVGVDDVDNRDVLIACTLHDASGQNEGSMSTPCPHRGRPGDSPGSCRRRRESVEDQLHGRTLSPGGRDQRKKILAEVRSIRSASRAHRDCCDTMREPGRSSPRSFGSRSRLMVVDRYSITTVAAEILAANMSASTKSPCRRRRLARELWRARRAWGRSDPRTTRVELCAAMMTIRPFAIGGRAPCHRRHSASMSMASASAVDRS